MKIIFSKLWIVVLPIALSLHLGKVLLFIFILLSIHEMMHIIVAKHFGISCGKVMVYPFGLCAYLPHLEHQGSWVQIRILWAGLSVHIIAYFILFLANQWDLISNAFFQYLRDINWQILVVNLLPIYPLDGSRILRSLLEFLFPYRISKALSLGLSLICAGWLLIRNLWQVPSVWLWFFLFLIVWINEVIHFKEEVRDFYLYRFLYGGFGRVKLHQYSDIYKNRQNLIFHNGKLFHENEFLSQYI